VLPGKQDTISRRQSRGWRCDVVKTIHAKAASRDSSNLKPAIGATFTGLLAFAKPSLIYTRRQKSGNSQVILVWSLEPMCRLISYWVSIIRHRHSYLIKPTSYIIPRRSCCPLRRSSHQLTLAGRLAHHFPVHHSLEW
jgi:hypothetical protein